MKDILFISATPGLKEFHVQLAYTVETHMVMDQNVLPDKVGSLDIYSKHLRPIRNIPTSHQSNTPCSDWVEVGT